MNRATLALLVAILALGAAVLPLALGGGELGVTNFDSLTLSDDLVVGDDVTITDDTTHTGDLTIAGALAANGGQSLRGHLTLGTSTPAALVTGTAVAPGALLQPVSMATAGTVPITIPSAGRIVCVWNTGTQAATFADSGNQVLAGNFAMGQYDVLCGISDGTRFIEITRSNN